MIFFKKLSQFIREVADDQRIPSRDKKILLVFLILIASPIDLIPDWIPLIGLLDDFVILSIVLDYLFNVLDADILMSHYPWSMKSFAPLRRGARMIAVFTPNWVKKKIWSFEADPLKK